MSDGKQLDGEPKQQAFEYVLGTLRGAERASFAQKLLVDAELGREVLFWEERLQAYQLGLPGHKPAARVWPDIERAIAPGRTGTAKSPWFAAWLATAVLLLGIVSWSLLAFVESLDSGINTEYVAVLTDESGAPLLTVLTPEGGQRAHLQWADSGALADDVSLQIWAISRRDKATRSLFVIDSKVQGLLEVDEAIARLIRDSEFLLLTQEEKGGSPFGEPSEQVLAKGVCVRIGGESKSDESQDINRET